MVHPLNGCPLIADSQAVRHRYQTFDFGAFDIHIRALRDNQQFSDPDHNAEALGVSPSTWPLFGLVWESAEILAALMLSQNVAGKRILEIGCGLGLASLVLNYRLANITATDYHPESEAYLRWNTFLNGGATIPFVRTGWEQKCESLGTFDLIIGSDILYQSNHPELVSRFIARHTSDESEAIIVDPSRGHFGRFSKQMMLQGFLETKRSAEELTLQQGQVKVRYYRKGIE